MSQPNHHTPEMSPEKTKALVEAMTQPGLECLIDDDGGLWVFPYTTAYDSIPRHISKQCSCYANDDRTSCHIALDNEVKFYA